VVEDFLRPLLNELQNQKIEVWVRQLGVIPQELCIDWGLYMAVLFQLVDNAIKASKKKTC
jgi:hypothetical protein